MSRHGKTPAPKTTVVKPEPVMTTVQHAAKSFRPDPPSNPPPTPTTSKGERNARQGS